MTTLPDGPLFSTCTEAAISSFGLGGGTVLSNERHIIDGNFGACPRCAKEPFWRSFRVHHGVVVHSWDAGFAAMFIVFGCMGGGWKR